MYRDVDTRSPKAVEQEVSALYRQMFPDASPDRVSQAFSWAQTFFTGGHPDYQPIDARYHDFEHTLQGTLCLARLLCERHRAGSEPILESGHFYLGLLAILFHDTGYLKRRGDHEGTGAKYTLVHVDRSADFARQFLSEKGFSPEDILAVQNMIRCTGVRTHPSNIPFRSQEERIVGFALGTADILGQMSAPDYVEKLPTLFAEFAEAVQFSGETESHIAGFKDARDLMQKTPRFWEEYVLPRLETVFLGLYHFLDDVENSGANPYVRRVQQNLKALKSGS